VIVFNWPIVEFRAAFRGQSPEERARRAQRNIEDLLSRGGDEKVTIGRLAQDYMVLIDGTSAFVVARDDADIAGGETAEAKAKAAAGALEEVIALKSEAGDRAQLVRAVTRAAIATVILCAIWWLFAWARTWIAPRIIKRMRARIDQHRELGVRFFARMADLILEWVTRLKLIYRLLLLLLTWQWAAFVLRQFPYTRYWGEGMNGYFLKILVDIGTAVIVALPDVLVAIVIFALAYFAHSLVRLFFQNVENRQIALTWIEPESALATRRLVSVGIWIFAMVMAYPYLPGSGSQAFKGLSVLVGVMISIGSSSIIAQAASGLIIMYTRTLKVGQYVRIAEVEGTVTQIGMFATHVNTGLDADLTLPNSLVLTSVTRNYSRDARGPGFVIHAGVTIGYDAPWRQVKALLVEAARRTPGIGTVPEPRAFQIRLSDFYAEYLLTCHGIPSDPHARVEIINDLYGNIQDTFNEQGVQIMSPHYFSDPHERKVVPREKWYAPPARPPET
jgi:small-conductance mechanosensitive channel